MTSSGAIDDDLIDSSVNKQGFTKDDFFIMSFTGTEDFAESGFTDFINSLLNKKTGNFVAGTHEENGNLYFRTKDGYTHDGTAFMTYMYNGLLEIYKTK